jgi:hypothetical protein
MTTEKTIATNRTKKISEVFAAGHSCKVYTLHGGFVGKPCDIEAARRRLDTFPGARLQDYGVGECGHEFCVDVHSNYWFTFKVN